MGLEPIQLVSRIRKDQDTQKDYVKIEAKTGVHQSRRGASEEQLHQCPHLPGTCSPPDLRTVRITLLLLERPVCGTL